MADFQTYTLETVRPEGRETLEGIEKGYGFVPNLLGTMIESPQTAEAYIALGQLLEKSSFSSTEQQLILLTVSRANGCEYCVAAHSTVASMQDVPAQVVAAIREDRPVADAKLEALRRFVVQVVEQRGWLEDEQLQAFFAAGYGQQQVFEVILAVSMKTISNYINHIAGIELDEAFAGQAWRQPDSAVA